MTQPLRDSPARPALGTSGPRCPQEEAGTGPRALLQSRLWQPSSSEPCRAAPPPRACLGPSPPALAVTSCGRPPQPLLWGRIQGRPPKSTGVPLREGGGAAAGGNSGHNRGAQPAAGQIRPSGDPPGKLPQVEARGVPRGREPPAKATRSRSEGAGWQGEAGSLCPSPILGTAARVNCSSHDSPASVEPVEDSGT